jgi:hypothetical protein
MFLFLSKLFAFPLSICRFSGKTGKISYRYDPDTSKYYELTPFEQEGLGIGKQAPNTRFFQHKQFSNNANRAKPMTNE